MVGEKLLTGNPHDPDECGELIGIGGQYTVHDIGGGRVMKIPNAIDGSRKFVGGWGPQIAEMTNKHMPMVETAMDRELCVPHVLRLAARYPVLSDVLAHPKAAAGLCFTQDKVRPIKQALLESEPAQVRKYIDASADIYRFLWRYGIHDYIWFFLVNNALDAEGRVVYLDFGETVSDTTWVTGHVAEHEWEQKQVLVDMFPDDLQDHYFRTMKDRLSGSNFETNWAIDLDDLDRAIIKSPTLDKRPEEIPSLVVRIIERANVEEGWQISGVSPDISRFFVRYSWKGSSDADTPDVWAKSQEKGRWSGSGVELQNTIYKAGAARKEGVIQVEDLPEYLINENDLRA